MAILRFLYRKMWNNRWFTLSTLLGLTVAVAFTMSIPMYSDGALKRLVAKTLEGQTNGLPPASLYMKYQAVGNKETDLEAFRETDQYIREELSVDIGFPVETYYSRISIRNSSIKPADTTLSSSKFRQLELASQPGLADLIQITQGRMFKESSVDGTIEAIVLQEALYRHEMHLDEVYQYSVIDGNGKQKKFNVKIVGTYKPKDVANPAWSVSGQEILLQSLMVSNKVLNEEVLTKLNIPLNTADWYYAFNLQNIRTSELTSLIHTLDRLDISLFQKFENTKVSLSFLNMLYDFRTQSIQMQGILFALAAPMIAMVFYYIAMNARQSLERQRTDIVVLKSRGGSTRKIIRLYLLEGLLLGGIALFIGSAIGWFMAKSIGSSSGFLSFVGRKAIPIDISSSTILYGLLAVAMAVTASVIPVAVFARSSIVSYKRSSARSDAKPVWQRWYIDIILLLLVAGGWYLFHSNRLLAASTGLSSDQLQVSPLLFFIPALFIFALGLLFLRLFPLLLKLFHRLGRTYIPVTLHLTLTQLSRSAKSYYPIMILLLLTVGLGVYNSSAARTIDLNSTDRTLYQYGTDVIVKTAWEGYQDQNDESIIYYTEPYFEPFRHLDGVEAAARVLRTSGKITVSGKAAGQGSLIGIDNLDFSKVAWFRSDLYPAHPYEYLNLLSYYEQAVLINTSFANKYQLKEGDVVTLSVGVEQTPIDLIVVGIVPFWPSLYPDNMPFFIANLDYVNNQMNKIPYEVWLKMENGAKMTPIIEKLTEAQIEVTEVRDVRNELIDQINHPSRGGVFGILSLGFLVSMLVSLIGYILYWFFALASRVVQFGILRAMGLKRNQLTWMLLLEQLLTTGLSIALGIGLGKLSSYIFLPFLQSTGESGSQIPPFQVVFEAQDTVKLYYAVAVMMIIGFGLLFMQIRKLRVHQAVKLGEER